MDDSLSRARPEDRLGYRQSCHLVPSRQRLAERCEKRTEKLRTGFSPRRDRGGLRPLADAGLDVVAKVGDGPSLIAAVEQHRPDIAIVDVRMPPGYRDEGLKAAIESRRRVPNLCVLVLSQYVE